MDGGLQIVNNSITEHTYYVKAVDENNNQSDFSIPVTVDVEHVSQSAKRNTDDPDIAKIPENFELTQNYPNPFNPTTIIAFALPETGPVRLQVFDLNGKRIKELVNRNLTAGRYEISFDAGKLGSGIYVYRLTAGEFTQTRKMLLIK